MIEAKLLNSDLLILVRRQHGQSTAFYGHALPAALMPASPLSNPLNRTQVNLASGLPILIVRHYKAKLTPKQLDVAQSHG